MSNKKLKTPAEAMPQGRVKNAAGETALPPAWVNKLMAGWAQKERMAQIERETAVISAEIIAHFQSGDVLIVPGVCRVTVVTRTNTVIIDPERLERVVGDSRFGDLVRETVGYKAEPKLIEMACDADEPLAASIRACVSISRATTATWRAEGQKEAKP